MKLKILLVVVGLVQITLGIAYLFFSLFHSSSGWRMSGAGRLALFALLRCQPSPLSCMLVALQGVYHRRAASYLRHPYTIGNGASIKSGAYAATGEYSMFVDADSQHRLESVEQLVEELQKGYDMAMGARTRAGQASFARMWANGVYNLLASSMVGDQDLTSGLRAVRTTQFRDFCVCFPIVFLIRRPSQWHPFEQATV